jgi:hypothetical protein
VIVIGVDIAHMGEDRSVAIVRRDYQVLVIEDWSKLTIPQSAERVERLCKRHRADKIIVDADGLGAGVADILRQQGLPVIAFHGQARTEQKDASGELGFLNARSLCYWNLRCLLDPTNKYNVILPPHDSLLGDLCAPRWSVNNQRIEVERKDMLKKRLGRSPDFGDALAYCFNPEPDSSYEDNYRVYSAAQIDHLIQQQNPTEISPEESQIDRLMWSGAHNNHDVTSDY